MAGFNFAPEYGIFQAAKEIFRLTTSREPAYLVSHQADAGMTESLRAEDGRGALQYAPITAL